MGLDVINIPAAPPAKFSGYCIPAATFVTLGRFLAHRHEPICMYAHIHAHAHARTHSNLHTLANANALTHAHLHHSFKDASAEVRSAEFEKLHIQV
jgi:hypothetical protein